MLSLADIEAAAKLIYPHVLPTPQYRWPLLSRLAGCEVWLKHENHSPIGCFKLRGGLAYVEHLAVNKLAPNGLIAPTRGNHGQSIAYASRVYGLRANIVVPFGNGREKNAAMRAHGAILIEHGADYQEAREYAISLEQSEGLHMVRSFTPQLLRGVATYPLELLTAVNDLDAIYVPVGMGSGICATLLTRDLVGARAEVIGVVADAAPAYALSFDAGAVVRTASADTIADGLACRSPDPGALELICSRAARIVRVSDEEMIAAAALMLRATHNLVEFAGAAPLAALLKERELMRGKKAALVVSGGNLDSEFLPLVLNRLASRGAELPDNEGLRKPRSPCN